MQVKESHLLLTADEYDRMERIKCHTHRNHPPSLNEGLHAQWLTFTYKKIIHVYTAIVCDSYKYTAAIR